MSSSSNLFPDGKTNDPTSETVLFLISIINMITALNVLISGLSEASGPSIEDIWSYASRTLTDKTGFLLASQTSPFTDYTPTRATYLDLLNTNLNAKIGDVKTKTDLIGASVALETGGNIAAIKAVTDAIKDSLTFQLQPFALLQQATPVQNTWYTVLDTTIDAQVQMIVFDILTTGETLEIKVTQDGLVLDNTQVAAASTSYYPYMPATISPMSVNQCSISSSVHGWGAGNGAAVEARSIKVEIRKTTASGTGTLRCGVVYAKRV